jgi:hypothetical protein
VGLVRADDFCVSDDFDAAHRRPCDGRRSCLGRGHAPARVWRADAVEALRGAFRIMWIGFFINASTGIALFISEADDKGTKWIFWVKLLSIALALVVTSRLRRTVFGGGVASDGRSPRGAKPGGSIAVSMAGGDHCGAVDGRISITSRSDRSGRFSWSTEQHHVPKFRQLLHKTPLSLAFQHQVAWLWPTCETIHFAGLALLLGVAGNVRSATAGFHEAGAD